MANKIRVAYPNKLWHYGIPGMKKGVRRGPPYPLGSVQKASLRTVLHGHKDAPRDGVPGSIADHVYDDGRVSIRTHYGANGRKDWEIHTNDHGRPVSHPFGKHGEHFHEYIWDDEGRLISKIPRELTQKERKENRDIV